MSRVNILSAISLALGFVLICPAEEVIWRIPPLPGFQAVVPDRTIPTLGPLGGFRDYLLCQVLVECEPGEPRVGLPGTVKTITTYFANDAPIEFEFIPGSEFNKETQQWELPGNALINVFPVPGPADLPDNLMDDPDAGIPWPVVFSQNLVDNWIEVRATDLELLLIPIVIQPNNRYFVGLTPDFPPGGQPFDGIHLTNASGIGTESQSAVRMTDPVVDDWMFAGDVYGPPEQLFGAIELTGPSSLMLGDVNQDGLVNLLDIDPFVLLIDSADFLKEADINGDGFVNLLDVDPFIAILSGL